MLVFQKLVEDWNNLASAIVKKNLPLHSCILGKIANYLGVIVGLYLQYG
jgi:hypothetical protein